MFLFSLSNTLETYAMGRTHASIRALLDMTPKEADVYRDDQIVRVPVEELRVDDRVLVRPGAQVPADGQVITGESAWDLRTTFYCAMTLMVVASPFVTPADDALGEPTNMIGGDHACNTAS